MVEALERVKLDSILGNNQREVNPFALVTL